MSNRLASRFVVAVTVGLFASFASAGERSYTFYLISYPFCQSEPLTDVTEVNDSGVVTGYFLTDECNQSHGFTWVNGVMTDLNPTYQGGIFSAGIAAGS